MGQHRTGAESDVYDCQLLRKYIVSIMCVGLQNKKARLVLIGLDDAGKTSLMCMLKESTIRQTFPTGQPSMRTPLFTFFSRFVCISYICCCCSTEDSSAICLPYCYACNSRLFHKSFPQKLGLGLAGFLIAPRIKAGLSREGFGSC